MWIDVGGCEAMQTLRVYRPRVVIHGPVGMGQGYIGAAALHHLEGFHVQSLELGTLMGDSTRVGFSLLNVLRLFWLISANSRRLSKLPLSSCSSRLNVTNLQSFISPPSLDGVLPYLRPRGLQSVPC